MSVSSGITLQNNNNGTYNITYDDPSIVLQKNTTYELLDANNNVYSTYYFDDSINSLIQNSPLNNPFSIYIVKKPFVCDTISFEVGNLIIGNKYAGSSSSLNIFDSTNGNYISCIPNASNLYNFIILPPNSPLYKNSFITTNYDISNIIIYPSDNIANPIVIPSVPRINFLNCDNNGSIFIIYQIQGQNNTAVNVFANVNLNGNGNQQIIPTIIEGITDTNGNINNNTFVFSFTFDDENSLFINFVQYSNVSRFYIYKYYYDSLYGFKRTNDNFNIDYTPYINNNYLQQYPFSIFASLGTYSIVFDKNKNIYLSVVGNSSSLNLANSYTILQFDPNGIILNSSFVSINMNNSVSEYISFDIFNDSMYILSAPTNEVFYIKSIFNTSLTFSNVTLKIGSNILSITDTNSILEINIPYSQPDPPGVVTFTRENNDIILSWIAPTIIGGNSIINYKVFMNGIFYNDTNDLTYRIYNVDFTTSNIFSVTDVNDGNIESIYSNEININADDNIFIISELEPEPEPSVLCFKEGTKILCRVTEKEDAYIPIERITDNTFVKTWKHGYKRVKYVLQSELQNSSKKTINKLYKMSKSKYPILTEDLYITGSHAVLYDSLSDQEQWKMEQLINHFHINYRLNIDGKKKLIAYYDDRFEEWNENGSFTIYHFILESKTADRNYGIYANGILVESTDEITMSRVNEYSLVNQGYQQIDEWNRGLNTTKNNGMIETKLEKYKQRLSLYKDEDIIKKKVFLEQEKNKKEQETQSVEKCNTQKRWFHRKPNNVSLKKESSV